MSRTRVNVSKLNDTDIRRLIIDGDIFVYTLGFAVEEKIEWPGKEPQIYGDLPLAKRLLDNRIRYFTSGLDSRIAVSFVITGDAPCWRKALTSTYKAGRGRKPVDYDGIRAYMRSLAIFYETTDGLEADDYMATETSREPDSVAIMSFDKDFFTSPGTFIHMAQNSSARLYRIRPNEALCFLFFQALSGDRVDSYKGVDSIGPNKAKKMLQLCELKGLTIRQAYLLLKSCVRKREKQFKDLKCANRLWKQFRECLDLAALVQDGETASRGIGLRRVFANRTSPMVYFLPYYDPDCTHEFTKMKL